MVKQARFLKTFFCTIFCLLALGKSSYSQSLRLKNIVFSDVDSTACYASLELKNSSNENLIFNIDNFCTFYIFVNEDKTVTTSNNISTTQKNLILCYTLDSSFKLDYYPTKEKNKVISRNSILSDSVYFMTLIKKEKLRRPDEYFNKINHHRVQKIKLSPNKSSLFFVKIEGHLFKQFKYVINSNVTPIFKYVYFLNANNMSIESSSPGIQIEIDNAQQLDNFLLRNLKKIE